MKLLHAISCRLSFAVAIVMAIWSVLFYMAVMEEVNDETDDALGDYAEVIMLRALRGEPLPDESTGSNNQYFLREVSPEYAAAHTHIRYEDRDVFIMQRREHEPARVLSQIFHTDDGGWMELEVSTPHIEKAELKEAIALWLVILYAGLALAVVALNYFSTHRAMRPLYRLLDWLDNYRLGEKNAPLDNPTRIEEFSRLNKAATSSMERNEKLHEQQRQFIANASHEIQTPLAICQNRLELLLEDEALSEQQMGEIISIRRTLNGLSRLNRSLLLLCKIEGGRFPNPTPVCFGNLLQRLLPDFQELYAARSVRTETRHSAEAPCWEMDESLAETLLNNLLKNAYVHNRPGGMVRICLGKHSLTVSNTGETDTPLDGEAIFNRFYHTPGRAASTGLGLPIVKAVCQRYGLKVAYRHEKRMHVFEVSDKEFRQADSQK